MTPIFEGQPHQNKAEIPIKTRVIWVLGIKGHLVSNLRLATSLWKKKVDIRVESGKSNDDSLETLSAGDVQTLHVRQLLDDLAIHAVVIKIRFKIQDQLARHDVSCCDYVSFRCRPANSQMILQICFRMSTCWLENIFKIQALHNLFRGGGIGRVPFNSHDHPCQRALTGSLKQQLLRSCESRLISLCIGPFFRRTNLGWPKKIVRSRCS